MMQCPMISVAFDKYDKVLILTANDDTLKPQKETLLTSCGFDVDDSRFMIKGCQDVPGFDAVAKGEKVDVDYVQPGIVYMVKQIIKKNASIRAILLECTELPPYADALRHETKLAVFDAITNADFFLSARQDNPRFGFNQWQLDWDGEQEEYVFGQHLSADQMEQWICSRVPEAGIDVLGLPGTYSPKDAPHRWRKYFRFIAPPPTRSARLRMEPMALPLLSIALSFCKMAGPPAADREDESDEEDGTEEIFSMAKFQPARANLGPGSGSNLRAWALAAAKDQSDEEDSGDDELDWIAQRQKMRGAVPSALPSMMPAASLPSMRASSGRGPKDDEDSDSDVEPVFFRR
ncbi:ALMA7 [Symbiodinium microadriaticum]|nr:ALMA7 [Symbiodinium microadriaticum]